MLAETSQPSLPLPKDIAACLPADVGAADMADVVDAVAALSTERRGRLLEVVQDALANGELMAATNARVVAVRLLVSLLPASFGTVAALLRKRDGAPDYEMHFTLFCYLDWATEVPEAGDVAGDVLALVSDYLHEVPAKTAQAAWMAGDMLGDHWRPMEAALAVLADAVLNARFAAGRAGALYGLEQALKKLGREDGRRAEVRSLLRRVRWKDRSRGIRRSAADLLKDTASPVVSAGRP